MNIIADSSFVISVAVMSDPSHDICTEVYKKQDVILLPQSSFAEIGYFLTKFGKQPHF